jgi:hypothetical protein
MENFLKLSLIRLRRSWEDNIKLDLWVVDCEDWRWMELAFMTGLDVSGARSLKGSATTMSVTV